MLYFENTKAVLITIIKIFIYFYQQKSKSKDIINIDDILEALKNSSIEDFKSKYKGLLDINIYKNPLKNLVNMFK